MFVQFADSSEKAIIACFANQQDPDVFANQGEVDLTDSRYKTYFDSLPLMAQAGLPPPEL